MAALGLILGIFGFMFLGSIRRLLHIGIGMKLGWIFQGPLLWLYLLLQWRLILSKPFHKPILNFSLHINIPEDEKCWQCLLSRVPTWLQDVVMWIYLELNEWVF